MRQSSLIWLTTVACLIALIVVTLGAYTRISDAGLGCPDWPGCYNHLIVPKTDVALAQAQTIYPSWPIHQAKAWTEMIHRYFAGTLAILIGVIAISSVLRRREPGATLVVPLLLVGLVVFQALLGMWTVTLRLAPLIVMGHLLGGMTILALLWWLLLQFRDQQRKNRQIFTAIKPTAFLKPMTLIGLGLLALQISLGGWTSANYAALICPDFPACTASQFFPMHNFHQAFDIVAALHAHTAIGRLDQAALITIQMTHRFGAMLTGGFLILLALYILLKETNGRLRHLAVVILGLVSLQICLGVLNVMWHLPAPIAVLHNVTAALLLITLVSLTNCMFMQHQTNQLQ